MNVLYIYAAGDLPFAITVPLAKGYRAQSVAHALLSLDLVVCEYLSREEN